MTNNILDIPDLLIKKGLPFAIYSIPELGSCKLVFQKDQTSNKINILDIDESSGFVVARFDSAKTGMANLIKPDFALSEGNSVDEAMEFLNSLPDKGGYCFIDNIIISKSNYLDRADYLINKLKEGELQKVVLSRVIKKNLKEPLCTSTLFKKLKEKYTSAFVYLFHLPEEGTWCGASPETLFKVLDGNIHTMALAATRLANENNGNPTWSLKEKEEQYFVSLFIESLLSELSIYEYEQTDPATVIAGNLAHLQTTFKIPISNIKSKIGRLIAGLHPTPAVCGLPKAEAYLLIRKAERHERRYYTGFLGPWKIDEESQLFVNLRCAEIDKNKINIYVGGGLTASSTKESEYEETVHKSQTLLSIVENL
ncbi:MAG: chorismate-binding protein [Methanosarcinaceae archaeon]